MYIFIYLALREREGYQTWRIFTPDGIGVVLCHDNRASNEVLVEGTSTIFTSQTHHSDNTILAFDVHPMSQMNWP